MKKFLLLLLCAANLKTMNSSGIPIHSREAVRFVGACWTTQFIIGETNKSVVDAQQRHPDFNPNISPTLSSEEKMRIFGGACISAITSNNFLYAVGCITTMSVPVGRLVTLLAIEKQIAQLDAKKATENNRQRMLLLPVTGILHRAE